MTVENVPTTCEQIKAAPGHARGSSASSTRKSVAPWFKCFPSDWLEGTRSLTPEQRGIYFDCLCIIYEFERPLPLDDKWMSHQLHISARLWRSVREQLVIAGKLIKTESGYVNDRALSEIETRSSRTRVEAEPEPNQTRTETEPAANQPRTDAEYSEKDNEISAAIPEMPPDTRACLRYQITEDRQIDIPPTPKGGAWEDELAKLYDEHANVSLLDGNLILHNGYRTLWLDRFDGDAKRLDLALAETAATLQPRSRQPLEAQVARKLAAIAGDRHDRDARYAAAVKNRPTASASQDPQPSRVLEAIKRREARQTEACNG